MKRSFVALMLLILLLCVSTAAGAQFSFLQGYPYPFVYPMPFWGVFPPLLPSGPFFSFGAAPRTLFPALARPVPMIRQARATVTILFNPALSVIQVTVLPLSPIAPVVPTALVAPTTTIAPALPPSALLLLPLLSGLGTSTQPNLNFNSTSTVATPVPSPVVNSTSSVGLTGLSALLPFI